MPLLTSTKQLSLYGQSYNSSLSVNYEGAALFDLVVPPAKPGVLTVRTDNVSGSLTLTAGHGITTGNRLDLFWSVAGVNYGRRGCVAGTVAGVVVPFSGGAGDVLPAAASAVNCAVPVTQPLPFTGNNAICLAAGSEAPNAQIVLVDGAVAELVAIQIRSPGVAYTWFSGDGTTNPVAGVAPVNVLVSHGDPVSSLRVYGGAGIN